MLSALKARAPSPYWDQPGLETTHHGVFNGLHERGQSQRHLRIAGVLRTYVPLGGYLPELMLASFGNTWGVGWGV